MKNKRKDVYLSKNGVVYFSKSFICKSILELMVADSKRLFIPTKIKTNDLSLKDPNYFVPTVLYNKLADVFEAFYNKRPDKTIFYLCIVMLEKQKKLKRIKIKRQVFYQLIV